MVLLRAPQFDTLFGASARSQLYAILSCIADSVPRMGFFTKQPASFSNSTSKRQFVEDWTSGVMRDAGSNPERQDAAFALANMAADACVRKGLIAVAEAYGDLRVATYLDGLDLSRLVYFVDDVYNTTIEMATAGRPGPVLRERISAFDRQVNEHFTELRPNYVEYARVNYGAAQRD